MSRGRPGYGIVLIPIVVFVCGGCFLASVSYAAFLFVVDRAHYAGGPLPNQPHFQMMAWGWPLEAVVLHGLVAAAIPFLVGSVGTFLTFPWLWERSRWTGAAIPAAGCLALVGVARLWAPLEMSWMWDAMD